jgi:hypothetical protein
MRLVGLMASLSLGLCLQTATSAFADSPPVPLAEAQPKQAGIAVIGASASAGWGVMVPVLEPGNGNRYRHVTLADALAAVAPELPPVVTASGDPLFFRQRSAGRAAQVDRALEANPEAVIAVDFLFWYGFGTASAASPQAEARLRMKRLNAGIAQLQRLVDKGIPVIVGDLPDVSDAAGAMLYSVIGEAQMPSPTTRVNMNTRIANWVDVNDNVQRLALSQLMRDMQQGKAVRAGGIEWGPTPRLMQHDKLHPTAEGLLAVAARAVDQLHRVNGHTATRTPVDRPAARYRLRGGVVDTQVTKEPVTP